MKDYDKFKGKMLKDVIDAIDEIAAKHNLRSNIVEEGHNYDIDVEDDRLNIMIDNGFIIKKFWVG